MHYRRRNIASVSLGYSPEEAMIQAGRRRCARSMNALAPLPNAPLASGLAPIPQMLKPPPLPSSAL